MSIDYRLGKPQTKKITDSIRKRANEIMRERIPPQYRNDPNYIISDDSPIIQQAIKAAFNEIENKKKNLEESKKRQAEQCIMAEREKQRKERLEQEREFNKSLPERQLQMLLSGYRNRWSCCHMLQRAELYGHAKRCDVYTAIDI